MSAPYVTEPVFHAQPYRRELDVHLRAVVADERHGPALVLDRTLCHPHGGGQKGDRATLVLDEATAEALGVPARLPLTDTRKGQDATVLHLPGLPLDAARAARLPEGARGRLELDWDFRWRQMRLHSAAHLLHGFVAQVLGTEVPFPDTSDLQPDFGLNRYEQKQLLSEVQAAEVVERLNAFTAEGHAITTYPHATEPGFRYWQCEAWIIPCGGTHPADTREIGPVSAVLGLKRGRTSLTFRLAEG